MLTFLILKNLEQIWNNSEFGKAASTWMFIMLLSMLLILEIFLF